MEGIYTAHFLSMPSLDMRMQSEVVFSYLQPEMTLYYLDIIDILYVPNFPPFILQNEDQLAFLTVPQINALLFSSLSLDQSIPALVPNDGTRVYS